MCHVRGNSTVAIARQRRLLLRMDGAMACKLFVVEQPEYRNYKHQTSFIIRKQCLIAK